MKRPLIWIAAFSLAATAGCAGKQKTEEAKPETAAATAPSAPQVPMCGRWVVVVEKPIVASGAYQQDQVQRDVLEGMRSSGCTALPRPPTALPEGATVLTVTVKVTSTGENTGKISAIATDTATGQVRWRFQETVTGPATTAARGLGEKLGRTVQTP